MYCSLSKYFFSMIFCQDELHISTEKKITDNQLECLRTLLKALICI